MATPTPTREFRIPDSIPFGATAEAANAGPNVGPQLQAILTDPTKFGDGTRLIWPENRFYRADAGLVIRTRKNWIWKGEGAALTSPLDMPFAFTRTDCVITNARTTREPTADRVGLYAADVETQATVPNFFQQLWYAQGMVPAGSRAARVDSRHIMLSGGKPFTNGTNRTITFSGPNDRARTMLSVVDCDDFAINNLKVVGANENGGTSDAAWDVLLEAQHGLALAGCVGWSVYAPNIAYVWGDCIATMRGGASRLCAHGDINYPNLHHNGRCGITPKGITDTTVRNPYMRAIRRNCINIEPNDPKDATRRFKVTGGSMRNYRFSWFSASSYTDENADVGDIEFDNVELSDIGTAIDPGPSARWGPFAMTRLRAMAPTGGGGGYAIGFDRCDGVKVRDSILNLQEGRNMRGVKTTACTAVDIGGNDWSDGVGEYRSFP